MAFVRLSPSLGRLFAGRLAVVTSAAEGFLCAEKKAYIDI
jgi:hypothetical protein